MQTPRPGARWWRLRGAARCVGGCAVCPAKPASRSTTCSAKLIAPTRLLASSHPFHALPLLPARLQVTLVFAAKDPRYNNAVVLQEYLRQLADAGKGGKPAGKEASPPAEEEEEVVIVDDEEEEEEEEEEGAPVEQKGAKKRKVAA